MSEYEDEFEYEDEEDAYADQPNDKEAQVEDLFYDAEDCKSSSPLKALDMFREVSNTPSAWAFKALVHVICLSCRLGRIDSLEADIVRLIKSLDNVTRNEISDGLFAVLDAMDALQGSNESILTAGLTCILRELELRSSPPFPVWFSAASRLMKLSLEKGDFQRAQTVLEKMQASCRDAEGHDDVLTKASQLVDIYAFEIRLIDMVETGNKVRRMKEVLKRCERVNSAVCNPRSIGVLREYAGKVLMSQGRYEDAYNEFYEAFRALSDSGQNRGKKMLKYAVVANILSLSHINPFDCREAKAYQTDPELTDIAHLRKAVDEGDLQSVHDLTEASSFAHSDDEWLVPYGTQLVYEVKQKYLECILPAYMSAEISSLGRRLKQDADTTRNMLKSLILDKRVSGMLSNDMYVSTKGDTGDAELDAELARSSKYMWSHTEQLLDKGVTVGNK